MTSRTKINSQHAWTTTNGSRSALGNDVSQWPMSLGPVKPSTKHDVERCGSGLWQDRSNESFGLERVGNNKTRNACCMNDYREEKMRYPFNQESTGEST